MAKNIEVDIEKFSYNEKTILKDIHFSVEKGECVVITGLSGCGKTSLLRLLNGLIPTVYDGDLCGNIKILEKSIPDYETGELARYVGNVFQNPNEQFFAKEVENEVAIIGENMGMDFHQLHTRVRSSLNEIGISNLKTKNVRELSGGQKQKVAIASTLVFDSEIIFLDEPSANLDHKSTMELESILKNLKEQGKTIVIAEHRLSYLSKLLDRLILLKDGSIKAIFSSKELNGEIERENDLRCFNYQELKSTMKMPDREQMIKVENIYISNNGYRLDSPINFRLHRGECMALIGENGIGKTTLAKELVGLLPMQKGTTNYGNSIKSRLSNTAISLQNCSNMFFCETVEKELIPKDKSKDESYLSKVKHYLLNLELWKKRMLNPHDLSGGEKQRLALLIALLKESKFIILDEPTAGLDYRRMQLVANVIQEKIESTPVMLITHDIELMFKICNTAYLISKNGSEKINVLGNETKIIDFFNSMGKDKVFRTGNRKGD